MIKGIYAGTFDPLTNGHIDIIKRSLSFCDQLVIAVGVNPGKNPLFTYEEREHLISSSLEYVLEVQLISEKIKVCSFSGLLGDFAREEKANIFIRGIRNVSDFEYEINLANINKYLAPEIETLFLPTSPALMTVSSSMVKEIAKFKGMIDQFVQPCVADAIYKKLK